MRKSKYSQPNPHAYQQRCQENQKVPETEHLDMGTGTKADR